MSLSNFGGVHPYVADRVRFLLRIADRYGGQYQVLSGQRTLDKQWELLNTVKDRPVAFPGCSQHNYGLAMDVRFRDPRWQRFFQEAARAIGLVTVAGDPNHVQAIPGNVFRRETELRNLCPSPGYVNRRNDLTIQRCGWDAVGMRLDSRGRTTCFYGDDRDFEDE